MSESAYIHRSQALKGVAGRPEKPINTNIIKQINQYGGSTRNKKELSRLYGFSLATFYRRLTKLRLNNQIVCNT